MAGQHPEARIRLSAEGVRPGRPKREVDAGQIGDLRAKGFSWRQIAKEMGLGYGTARRAHQERAKIEPKALPMDLSNEIRSKVNPSHLSEVNGEDQPSPSHAAEHPRVQLRNPRPRASETFR
jgi:hypothetical protein